MIGEEEEHGAILIGTIFAELIVEMAADTIVAALIHVDIVEAGETESGVEWIGGGTGVFLLDGVTAAEDGDEGCRIDGGVVNGGDKFLQAWIYGRRGRKLGEGVEVEDGSADEVETGQVGILRGEEEVLRVGDGGDEFAGGRKFRFGEIGDELKLEGGWWSAVLRGSGLDVEGNFIESVAGLDGEEVMGIVGVLGG